MPNQSPSVFAGAPQYLLKKEFFDFDFKSSCRAATTANITIATALNNGDTLDSVVTLATNDRVLVKDQSTGSQNGIYIVGVTPTRATDFDEHSEVTSGAFIHIEEGTANANTNWALTTDDPITVGTTDLTGGFTKITAAAVGVSDSTTNTNFPIVFHDESDALLDDTGAFTYNPSTGRVGIGVGSPTEKLEVFPDTDVSAIIGKAKIGYNGWADHAVFSHMDNHSPNDMSFAQSYVGSTFINAKSGQAVSFRIANNEKMKLTSSGNVELDGDLSATSSTSGKPLVTLETSNTTTDTSSELLFQNTATGATDEQVGKITFKGDNDNNQLEQFGEIVGTIAGAVDGSEKGRIELKVATNDATIATGFKIQGTAVAGRVDTYLGGNSSSLIISNGPFSVTGAITATGDITAFFSDKRLKTNIVIIESPLEKLQKLSGFTYDWHKDKCKEAGFEPIDERRIGVFAQDVQGVIPEAVKIAPFDRDDDGNSKSGENYLTVQYEKIVPLLIESIKEQQKQIEELRNEVELFKNK